MISMKIVRAWLYTLYILIFITNSHIIPNNENGIYNGIRILSRGVGCKSQKDKG